MCGIMGCSRVTDITRRMMPFLAVEMEYRGKDSWAVTQGTESYKNLGPITDTWAASEPIWHSWPRAIFHTRAASTGAITLDNQHPFVATRDGRKVVGIHNGIVSNHEELNKKYNRTFDCDSPHVYEAVVGNSPTNEVYGYGNLAWYDFATPESEPVLHLARFNGENLNIATLSTGELVFCSLLEPIRRAAKMTGSRIENVWTTQGDQDYYVGQEENKPGIDVLIKAERIIFGGRTVSQIYPAADGRRDFSRFSWMNGDDSSSSSTQSTHHQHRKTTESIHISGLNEESRRGNICLGNGCIQRVTTSRRKQLLCNKCMDEVIQHLLKTTVMSTV